ncbi:MAG: hypothetical protein DI598_15515 [Pseudopedobacter saltans]|uniref:Uncharacterized protein n=1 Tax=Pseudopedobacter saltans TaxID=151895 RepID=A0A2W5EHS4_9SPHI|nr:MAG: hypothetical protein DI598_15515 [Pseudopedobacter saltans]
MNNRFLFFLSGFVSIFLLSFSVKAQRFEPSFHIGAEYNYLYSTHSTKFRGPSVYLDKELNKHWAIGLGAGYNTCAYHPDNGYDLKDLKLVPIFASLTYTFSHNRLLDPYALFKTGVSIMSYDQKEENDNNPYQKIHSTGWYTYLGGGSAINISKSLQAYLNIGLIGYKMSFNDLDINPHGVAGNIGLRVKI